MRFPPANIQLRRARLVLMLAVLVRSVAGKLQIQRLSRSDGTLAEVFQDEAEALRYLRRD